MCQYSIKAPELHVFTNMRVASIHQQGQQLARAACGLLLVDLLADEGSAHLIQVGANFRFAADRLVSARPKERPGVRSPELADRASLATRRGGLTPGTAENEQRYTTYQRLVHETDARQMEWSRSRRTLVLQGMGAEAQSEASGCPIPSPPPASVWELPQERPMNHWPPAFNGGRVFQLLGDWPQD